MGEGLKKAARAAKRTRHPGTPEVAVRQVWADLGYRTDEGREVEVISLGEKTKQVWRKATETEPSGYVTVPYDVAVCSVAIGGKKREGMVSISLDRFYPTKTGYRYLRTLPAERE